MARTASDVENFLYELNRNFDKDGETFVVSSGADGPPIVLRLQPPILLVRVDIGPTPDDEAKQLAMFRQLLTYNASDLAHVAYGLDQKEVILSAAQELENLNVNEIAAVLNDIDLALAQHIKKLHHLAIE